jgi:predicted DsbA family dithiol-disulfide isomerase
VSFSLKELQCEYGAEIHWRSYELRPAGSPPIPASYQARIEEGRKYFENRALQEHGVTINSGPFGIDSRKALILEKYAQMQGKGEAFHQVVERAYWLEAQDISQTDVLNALLKASGLDTNVETVLADSQHESMVDADIQQAYQYGLEGVPAVVFENRYLVSGAQPYGVFKEVMERIRRE